jgi:hypothetical protein
MRAGKLREDDESGEARQSTNRQLPLVKEPVEWELPEHG